MNLYYLFQIALILTGIAIKPNPLIAQERAGKNKGNAFESQFVFPFQNMHVHSSSVVELPNGDILCCWFEGSGERSANDVRIKGARLKHKSSKWSTPFLMADTPGQPDCNPVFFLDNSKKLWLFWIVVQANRWERSILKFRTSTDYNKPGPPVWNWQDILLLKPGNEFVETIKKGFRELHSPGVAWAEYAPPYEKMIYEAAKDPKKKETGWMTRTHPVTLPGGRILIPLYSDGYNLSIVAISDDQGQSWRSGLPIVGRGNVQPSIVRRTNGSLVAFMRDNGDVPGKIMTSTSTDNGYTWGIAQKTEIPNPGASIEALVLKDGNWIIVYNDSEDGRNTLAISLSSDEGKTWSYTQHLEKVKKGEGSFSYPSIIQAKDERVHVTYSYDTGGNKTIKHVVFTEEWIRNNE